VGSSGAGVCGRATPCARPLVGALERSLCLCLPLALVVADNDVRARGRRDQPRAGYVSDWAQFNREPITEPNRTELLVFSVFGFGFGFLFSTFRCSVSVSVCRRREPNNRSKPKSAAAPACLCPRPASANRMALRPGPRPIT